MIKGSKNRINETIDYGNSTTVPSIGKFFTFLRVGKFYWRLWGLLLMGYSLSFTAYQLSSGASHGESVLPLSYSALFYTLFLIGLAFIGSGLRDHLGGSKMLDQILLWPMEERKKMMILYLRTTWIPLILLLVGGFIGNVVAAEQGSFSLLPMLPYGLAAAFFLSILSWKGSMDSVDIGMVVGSATFRKGRRLMFYTMIITLSPLLFAVVPYFVANIAAVVLIIAGVIYQILPWDQLQISEGAKDLSYLKNQENTVKLSKLEGIRNPIYRYFNFLEWDEIKRPGVYYGIMISAVFFITMIYYILGGYYFPSSEPAELDRSLFLGFLIAYGTFFIYHISLMMIKTKEVEVLLPLSKRAKSVADFLHYFLRPMVYLILNGVLISALIGLVHLVLMQFISLPEIAYGRLVIYTLRYVLLLIPFILAFYSIVDFLLNGINLLLQKLGFLEARKWLVFVFFVVYLMPLVASLISFAENPSVFSALWEPLILFIFAGVFILSRWGIYWTSKRIQVI